MSIKLLAGSKTALIAAMVVFPISASAGTSDLPGGFRLGSSLVEAKQHSISKGWQLTALSPSLPGEWSVGGQGIGLFVCDDLVVGIHQHMAGDLDEFAHIVSEFRCSLGKPEI